jgi:hypothetical protein
LNKNFLEDFIMKYKVGDKVRIVSKWPKNRAAKQNRDGLMDKWLGKVMTIRDVGGDYYRMEEDEHELPFFNGWVWNEACIAGPVNRKIIVMTDGVTTTAKLFSGKELVKSAEAKCSPDDTFCFEAGAAIAIGRLLGREEQKPANPFKVGDYVRVTASTHYCQGLAIGSAGRVIEVIDAERCEVDGFGRDGHRIYQTVHPCDLEKI